MIGRRAFLASASAAALLAPSLARATADAGRIKLRPVPLTSVHLPSIRANAVETNRRTLMALSPNRFLHNFHEGNWSATKG